MQTIIKRLLLLLAFVGMAAVAQEPATEAAQAAEIDELEPGVSSEDLSTIGEDADSAAPTAVLAQDVRRRQVNNGVMDEIDLGRTEVTGNQELPKVLYIVPWKKSDPGNLTARPVNTLLDEVLAPIDRSEFIRQVDYYDELYVEKE
jgi:predicted membrane-bound mannosyltransferase